MNARAANIYRSVDLESAPKSQIVDRLFARFAQDVEAAKAALAAKDIHTKAKTIDHASCIVVELKAALDHTQAPELCANLESLYDFVLGRLAQSNLSLAPGPLDQAARIMTDLATAFREAGTK
jgi:flagellar protein FliS